MAKSKPLKGKADPSQKDPKGKYETTDGSKKKPNMTDDLFDTMFGNKDIADKKKPKKKKKKPQYAEKESYTDKELSEKNKMISPAARKKLKARRAKEAADKKAEGKATTQSKMAKARKK